MFFSGNLKHCVIIDDNQRDCKVASSVKTGQSAEFLNKFIKKRSKIVPIKNNLCNWLIEIHLVDGSTGKMVQIHQIICTFYRFACVKYRHAV